MIHFSYTVLFHLCKDNLCNSGSPLPEMRKAASNPQIAEGRKLYSNKCLKRYHFSFKI